MPVPGVSKGGAHKGLYYERGDAHKGLYYERGEAGIVHCIGE